MKEAATQPPLRVFLVDDQVLVREGLKTLLDLDERVDVVGEASSGQDALNGIPAARPEVALVDVRMPEMDGVELATRLSVEQPSVAVVLLTSFEDDEYVFGGLRAGARGYLLKNTPSEELVPALVKAGRGETVLGGAAAGQVVSRMLRLEEPAGSSEDGTSLSGREVEVLKLVGEGHTNSDIAQTLHITPGTAKNHISRIIRKLEVGDRLGAALYARERWPSGSSR
ncbi:response regulator transcription factor [soil metagenome]